MVSRSTTDHRFIAVRFHTGTWRVEGHNLSNDLAFGELADAERVALALARRRRNMVQLYDRAGKLTTTYYSPSR